MKKIVFSLFLLPLLATAIAWPLSSPASAANPLDIQNQQGFGPDKEIPKAFGQEAGNPTDPRQIAANVIKIILTLLGIIFITLIVFAGFKWMTAGGNSEQVDEAKKLITNAVIGLVVILAAYSITVFVSSRIIGATKGSGSIEFKGSFNTP